MNTSPTESTPLRFILNGDISDVARNEAFLCCPVCGGTYCHLGPVVVEQGKTVTTVGKKTTVEPGDRASHARGSLVRLNFYGECGHHFCYELQFHKGNVTVGMQASVLADFECWETLWRD